jgi:hypothetical protein
MGVRTLLSRRTTNWERLSLSLFLCGFLVLGTHYALTNPLCKPDEGFHYAYAIHLWSGHGLPIIRISPERPGFTAVEMEGHQPPLFYAAVAAVARLFHLQDKIPVAVNPYLLGTLEGNRSPWTPVYSAFSDTPIFFTGRLIALSCGVLALLFGYLFCRLFLPWPLALLSVAFMGFNPQFIFIATSFSNDMPVTAAVQAGLWALGKAFRRGIGPWEGLRAGFTIAVATLVKLTGLGLLLPFILIAFWQAWKQKSGKSLIWAAAGSLLIGIIDGWWFWRNWTLYRHPFATNLLPVFLGLRTIPWTAEDFKNFLVFLWKSYWLDFSPGGILFADPWLYTVTGMICVLAVMGLAFAVTRDRSLRPFFLLVWGWFALVLGSLFQLTSKTAILMGGGRLLLPAAIAVGATLAVGLTRLCRHLILPAGLAILLGIFAAIAPARYLYPAFPRPLLVKNLESPPAYPLDAHFGNRQFELIGYDLEQTELSGQRAVRITYYWRALEKTDRNFSVFIHLETQEGGQPAILTQTDTYTGYGIWPTSAWRPDWIFVDHLALPLPPPGQAFSGTLLTGLYFLPTMERLPAYDRAGQRFPADAVPLACIWTDEGGVLHLAAPTGPGAPAIADSPCDGSNHQ